ISTVTTDSFDTQYGTPLHSVTENVYGLTGAAVTNTAITTNSFNGLNTLTVATNAISTVTTDSFDTQYGTPLHSITTNVYGLTGATVTNTNITSNSFNGLNTLTVATNALSTVTTDSFDTQYGTPLHSVTENVYGLTGAAVTNTAITTNSFNGLNTLTVATNALSTVTTDSFDTQYGTPLHSVTENVYGLTGAAVTNTAITTNSFNGLNTLTVATNALSTVTTDSFDTQYGTPLHSVTENVYGLTGAAVTNTAITTNSFNGLNTLTVATNALSTVTTDSFDTQYGTPLHSVTENVYGLTGAAVTNTQITSNPFNGLNIYTLATNAISTVETDSFDTQYGTPLHSITTNVYGLTGATVTNTNITSNSFNGLNTLTVATNAISTVTTDSFDTQYGTPLHSVTENVYGLTGATVTNTNITSNPFNGLNTLTVATNALSTVTTDSFDTQYGLPLHSITTNVYGLTGATVTNTNITSNSFNGLNTLTVATNAISTVTTDSFDTQYGTPLHSITTNVYGLTGATVTNT
ncbi:hypothetical protein K8S19_13635, partial [bacterium]|nr:hypothetical protein [bacterium]